MSDEISQASEVLQVLQANKMSDLKRFLHIFSFKTPT